jgi:hypothetical protein
MRQSGAVIRLESLLEATAPVLTWPRWPLTGFAITRGAHPARPYAALSCHLPPERRSFFLYGVHETGRSREGQEKNQNIPKNEKAETTQPMNIVANFRAQSQQQPRQARRSILVGPVRQAQPNSR